MVAKGKYERVVQPKLLVIEGWARDGLTLDQIAGNLRISKTTLIKYRGEHNELMNALKSGKEESDTAVVNALFRSAIGFSYTEEMITPQGRVVEVHKFQAPSTTAQIFWLKNRRPEQWRDKREVEHGGTISLADVLLRADELEDEHEKTVH